MSLHDIARQMAAQGRGPDKLLVHMTPNEVEGLQRLAMAKGGSLTINPQTGLPEAGFLDDVFEDVKDFATDTMSSPLGQLVIGAGLASMGIPPHMAALYVGGTQTVLTGDLKQGLFAGMGAYGGASMMGGLESLGTEELAKKEAADKLAAGSLEQLGGPGLENSVGSFTSPEVAGADALQLGGPEMSQTVVAQPSPIAADQSIKSMVPTTTPAPEVGLLDTAKQNIANAGAGFDRLTSTGGIDALNKSMAANAANPALGGSASLGRAAGWVGASALGSGALDSMGKQKGGGSPDIMPDPGYIRQYTYDPYTHRYTALAPVKADKWGNRSFQDAFKAADGGIVALAHGGNVPGFAGGGVSDDEIKAYVAANQNDPAAIAAAAQQYGVSAADLSRATGYTADQVGSYFSNAGIDFGGSSAPAAPAAAAPVAAPAPVDVNANINNWLQTNPNATYQQMREAAAGSGITDAQILGAYDKFGYSAADKNITMNKDWTNAKGLTGYQGLNDNINSWLVNNPTATKADALQAMIDSGLNNKDVLRATGKTLEQLYDEKKAVVNPRVNNGGGNSTVLAPGATTPVDLPTDSTTNAPQGTTNPYGNTNNPGDLTYNPNGTVTVQPNIPGRPYGGYSGIKELTNAYTAGGGSTGYRPAVVKTAAEHAAKYDKLAGGSAAAYDYLMGRAPNPIKPYTPTGEIMKPYAESVVGMPGDNTLSKNIFDQTTRKYVPNPAYKAVKYDQNTGVTTRGVSALEAQRFFATNPTQKAAAQWIKDSGASYDDFAAAVGLSVAEAKQKYPTLEALAKAAADEAAAAAPPTSTDTGAGANGGLMPNDLKYANGGMAQTSLQYAQGGLGTLGGYSDGGRLLKGPGDGVSDSIPASIGDKQPARLADGEFVIPARIVSELGNGSTDAGARKLYAMMDRVQKARGKTTGKNKVATNSRADKHLPA